MLLKDAEPEGSFHSRYMVLTPCTGMDGAEETAYFPAVSVSGTDAIILSSAQISATPDESDKYSISTE